MIQIILNTLKKYVFPFVGGTLFTLLVQAVIAYKQYRQQEKIQQSEDEKNLRFNTVFGDEKPGLINGETNLLMIEQLNQQSADLIYGECGVGVFWKFDNNSKVLEIHGYGPMIPVIGYESALDVEEDKYYKLAQIRNDVKKLIIYEGITYIEKYSFSRFDSLEEAYIGPNIKEIPYECFSDCKNLRRVHLPYYLEKIGGQAFFNCVSLEDISLPHFIKEIGGSAFYGCTSLRKIEMVNVGIINANAFSKSGIEEIIIYNAGDIRRKAFSDTKCLRSVTIEKYENIHGDILRNSGCKRISLGWGLYIDALAFRESENLESVTFGSDRLDFSNDFSNSITVYPEGLIELKENSKKDLFKIPPYYIESTLFRIIFKIFAGLLLSHRRGQR